MSHKVYLGVPGSGQLCWESAQAAFLCSLKHEVANEPSMTLGLNFNECWRRALLKGLNGECTHFAMMHTDLQVVEDEPGYRWIDQLVEEMDKVGCDFLSTPMAIKDIRGVTSSGIGDPSQPWEPWRRFTVAELKEMPVTFNAEMIGYGDKYLCHNEALCLFDMRKPVWYQTHPDGSVKCDFNVVEKITLSGSAWGAGGTATRQQETEDWGFSRKLWKMGVNSYISRRVKTVHFGRIGWSNYEDVGSYRKGDEDSAHRWRETTPA